MQSESFECAECTKAGLKEFTEKKLLQFSMKNIQSGALKWNKLIKNINTPN